jgi:hypothetical protein
MMSYRVFCRRKQSVRCYIVKAEAMRLAGNRPMAAFYINLASQSLRSLIQEV